ncbi:MAG: protein-methionine-sulfoxide reductase heme-binding subunit MsrQ [Gammaproteobacteria bacterium]|nr:protein-methionine-sulfoxide reductase heme-binding subunit MsrQ [Gammaproteobacteria bacterium]
MPLSKQKLILFIISLLPLAWMVVGLVTNQLGANPIETVTRDSGLWALRFLCLTLAITPIRWWLDINLVPFRRMLGLYVFFYASLHMLLYLGLDQFFDFSEIVKDIIKRPFITIGFFTYSALIPLAITSNNKMVKRLGGRRWKKLHRLTYFIAIASTVHFYMLVKQDKVEPLLYATIVGALLLPRLYRFFQSRMSQNKVITVTK